MRLLNVDLLLDSETLSSRTEVENLPLFVLVSFSCFSVYILFTGKEIYFEVSNTKTVLLCCFLDAFVMKNNMQTCIKSEHLITYVINYLTLFIRKAEVSYFGTLFSLCLPLHLSQNFVIKLASKGDKSLVNWSPLWVIFVSGDDNSKGGGDISFFKVHK